MTAIEPVAISDTELEQIQAGDLGAWAEGRLIQVWGDLVQTSAKAFKMRAVIWMELRRRKSDAATLKAAFAKYLPWVADDQLAPEVVQTLAYEWVFETLRGVALERQRELAAGGTFKVVTDAAGKVLETTVERAGARLLKRAFRNGQELSIEDQHAYYRAKLLRGKSRQPRVVIRAAKEGQAPYRPIPKDDRDGANTVAQVVDLLPLEAEALQKAAEAVGISVRELIRMTLHSQGYLTRQEKRNDRSGSV